MQLTAPVAPSSAQAWFLDHLPEIHSRSRACFSRLQGDRRDEAVAEVVGSVFKACVSAADRGVLAKITPYHAVVYASRQYRAGRRLAGTSTTDVMAEATRIKGRVKVVSFADPVAVDPSREVPGLSESLSDRHSDQRPFEQVRMKLDYAEIFRRERVSKKAREVFRLLSAVRGAGHGNYIAGVLKVSPGRVSQLKTELRQALEKHGYMPNANTAS